MPKVEVDENEILEARALKSVLSKITSDPKRARALEQLHKEADPNVRTPLADAQAPVMAELEGLRKELKESRDAWAADKAEREKKETLAAATTKFDSVLLEARKNGYTDTGIEELKKIMEEKGIMDFEAVDATFQRRHPPAAPIQPGTVGSYDFLRPSSDDDKFTDELIKTKGDSMAPVDKIVNEVLAEARGIGRR